MGGSGATRQRGGNTLRGWAAGSLVAALALALALGGGFAEAGKGKKKPVKLKLETVEKSVTQGPSAAVDVNCKGKSRLISAGFDAPPTEGQGSLPYTLALGKAEALVVTYSEVEVSLTAQANCAKGVKTKIVSAEEAVQSGGIGSATATCPKGFKAMGGGFDKASPLADGATIVGSHMEGKRGWTARVSSSGGLTDVKVFAVCAKGVKGLKSVKKLVSPAVGVMTGSTLACPAGQQAISGGFDSLLPDGLRPPNTGLVYVTTSMRANKRKWDTVALGASSYDNTFETYTYCRKN